MGAGVPHVGHIAGEQRVRLPPIVAVVIGHTTNRRTLLRRLPVAPGGVIRDAVRRVGDHEVGVVALEVLRYRRRVGRVATQQTVRPERKQRAALNVAGCGCDGDVVLVVSGPQARAKELLEFLVRPQRGQVDALGEVLLEQVDVPVQIEFANAVVGERQFAGPRIGAEVQVGALDHDETVAGGRHDVHGKAQRLGDIEGLVTCQHHPMPVSDDGARRAICFEGAAQERLPARGAAIGVQRIGREVCEVPQAVRGRCRRCGRHACLSGAVLPLMGGAVLCRIGGPPHFVRYARGPSEAHRRTRIRDGARRWCRYRPSRPHFRAARMPRGLPACPVPAHVSGPKRARRVGPRPPQSHGT